MGDMSERVAKYAEAMWKHAPDDAALWKAANAVMAVADAEQAELRADRDHWIETADDRLVEREELRATLAKVRRALDDEEANLRDDGARLSHSVVRRIRAIVGGEEQA